MEVNAMSNLKELRIKAGVSRPKLAEMINTSVRTLEAYEQGLRNVDGMKIETLLTLSTALNCRISDIVENEQLKEKLKANGY